MAYFSTKRQIRTFEYRIHWNINIRKKILYEKINDSVVWNKHSGSSINEKPNSTMSVMLCTGATSVKKNSCLVTRIVSFDTVKSWNSIFLNSELFLLTRMFTI